MRSGRFTPAAATLMRICCGPGEGRSISCKTRGWPTTDFTAFIIGLDICGFRVLIGAGRLRTVLGAGGSRGQAGFGWVACRDRGVRPMMFDEEPVRVTKRLLDDMSIQELK